MDIRLLLAAAVALLALSGCGSQSTYDVRAPITKTIASPRADATVRCTKGAATATAKVPSPNAGAGVNADGTDSSVSLQLRRHDDGSLVVICSP